ncbi:hypothetical protein EDB81DRAFT_789743 [Dactylonectria macrodidyma]|uniref:Zn(2)-C6 fungal-type domain-containing protein n=1 Tax=Dactylonectria macrodidyma TaxID=307937 RepID=A0A9P9F4Q1_9HYPO|nr:hypothetical protein EDB81DRAFT_789743 [Dactylonectria macrodidyma]
MLVHLGQRVLRFISGYSPNRPPQTTLTSNVVTRSNTTKKSANIPSTNTSHPISRSIPTPSLDSDSNLAPGQVVPADEQQSERHVELKGFQGASRSTVRGNDPVSLSNDEAFFQVTTPASTPATTEDEYDTNSIATTSPESETTEFLQLLSLCRSGLEPQLAETRQTRLDSIDTNLQPHLGIGADNEDWFSGSLNLSMVNNKLVILSDAELDLHVGGQASDPDTEPVSIPKDKKQPMATPKAKPKSKLKTLAAGQDLPLPVPYPPTAGCSSQVEYYSDSNGPDERLTKAQCLKKQDSRKKATQGNDKSNGICKMDIDDVKLGRKTACLRCRMHKKKCVPNPNDPEGECLPCLNVCKSSVRLLRPVICVRYRLADVTFYRRSGLKLTTRWSDVCMKDVCGRFPGEGSRTIYLSLGLCKEPIKLEVVRFQPMTGDVTARYWTDYSSGREVRHKKELTCYCLADIHATAAEVEEYIVSNALHGMVQFVEKNNGCKEAGSPFAVTERTFGMAVTRFLHICEKPFTQRTSDEGLELRLLGNTLILWFAIQHSTGSSHIEGEETLDMKRESTDPSYPMQGKISTPRMIIAQFDNLNYLCVLQKYKNKLLHQLFICMSQPRTKWWFTIYMVFFIVLREASWNSQDRRRHARANFGTRLRYSIPDFVENLQDGCNNLLAHWHYFRGVLPQGSKPTMESLKKWVNLTQEESNLIQLTREHPEVRRHLAFWKQYEQGNGTIRYDAGQQPVLGSYNGPQTKFNWDESHYWTSQLLDPAWCPHPTYQREPEI